MAGDWIKMRVDLAADPAVIGISSALDCTEFEVVGMLHHFWAWADAQSRDGHAVGVTKKWIDRYVHRDGFADQLERVGWLDVLNGGIGIPNFDRHNGASAKTRGLAANRQQNKRGKTSRETSRSERDESVTREEKRREEKIEDQKQGTQDKPDRVKTINAKQLVAMGVPEQIAKDWLAIRKTKRAPLTTTALEAVQREASIAGLSLADAVRVSAERGWQGFKAEWHSGVQGQKAVPSRHHGFEDRDYLEGLTLREDGTYGI
jgi:hypothetical protein